MSSNDISVLKEIRGGEKRVILLPDGVARLTEHGYKVDVEDGAGVLSGYSNADYEAAGARIVDTRSAWTNSRLVLKYKAPDPTEYTFFRGDMHLASFMHAEGNLTLTEAMKASGMSAYALEFFETGRGDFPVPVSDNEISGKLAILMAAYHLQSHMGGRGVLLSSISGAPKPEVVVIGYGNAGGAAAHLAAAMGANVTVFGTRWDGLRRFQANAPGNIQCHVNEPELFEEKVLNADLVVGAILISTHDTPVMLPEDMVRRMKKGAVIVDVTCGYGSGYMPTFDRLTTHDAPFYERFGVLHCKIDAMPASVPVTAAHATNANIWRYIRSLADHVLRGEEDMTSQRGCLLSNGRIVHPELDRHIEMAAG